MKGKIYLTVSLNLAPHRHDARILDLVRELRRLIHERTCEQKVARQTGVPLPAAMRANIAAALTGMKRGKEFRERMSQIVSARYAAERAAKQRAQVAQRVAVNPWADL
jgi:hypothetical protein